MTMFQVNTEEGAFFAEAPDATSACKIVAKKLTRGYEGIYMAFPATPDEIAGAAVA